MEPLEQYMKELAGSAQRNSAFSKDIPFQQWRDELSTAFTKRLGGFPEIAEGCNRFCWNEPSAPGIPVNV